MDNYLDTIRDFYQVDSSTLTIMLLFSVTAAYSVRNKLNNPATIVLLAPLFMVVAMTTYTLAEHMHLFSPKRNVEWIAYTTFSASAGAIIGISFVAVLRLVQDKFVTMAHIRQTMKRDAEQTERGYPAIDIPSAHPQNAGNV